MKIAIASANPYQVTIIRQACERLGHDAVVWSPDQGVCPEAHVVLIDGIEAFVEHGDLPYHVVSLVNEEDLDLFPECPHPVTDFITKPLHKGELEARLRALCAGPTRQEQRHRELLGHSVESSEDIFELTTPDATFEYVNPAFEKAFGYAKHEAVGKTGAQLIRSGHHPISFFEHIGSELGAGRPWSGTIISKTKDGRTVYLDSRIAPVTNSKGQITHHVGVKRDITDRLMKERALAESYRALEQARDAAVDASRAKSEFLANMSHELRTPLNAIIGYSEMLIEDYEDDAQTVKDLNRIRNAGTHLLSLINDVLDLSKIEADKVELHYEELSLPMLSDELEATVAPLASKNGNELLIDIEPSLGVVVTDRTRLRQILLNLLSNACKFTSEGSVRLTVSKNEDRVRFDVVDTGIGISEEQGKRLFQPFVQADSSTTRKYGGTGLGLVISKRFAEMLGGSISFSSTMGQGTTFSLELPARTAKRSSKEMRAIAGRRALVLLIDDDSNVRDLFCRHLEEQGFAVACATGGEEGVQLASELAPDAIVLDVKMPDMSGWEVLSTLKLDQRCARIPVIMMTILEQEDVGRALGAADYLVKPIRPKQLIDTLDRFVGGKRSNILIVEDDEATRELVSRTLLNAGHSTLLAENGQIALDIIDNQRPDLIVLDLMMPVMDGFTFLDRLQERTDIGHIPTIVATARTLSESERTHLSDMTERVIQKGAFARKELLDTICSQVAKIVRERDEAGR